MTKGWQTYGGQATAKKLRAEAIAKYLQNPNYCLQCGTLITVQDGQKVPAVKKKKFCNRSCAASYNNSRTTIIYTPKTISCECCGIDYTFVPKHGKYSRKYCDQCYAERAYFKKSSSDASFVNCTKGELFRRSKTWQVARSSIRRHAVKVYQESCQSMQCLECGYATHIDIAHRKPVSEYPMNTTVAIINDLSNLVALCPNHHWEFDHGMLKLNIAG